MNVETGVMVMKDGKAWGVAYFDGYSTTYGWVDPHFAPIHNPKYCKAVTSVTYPGSPYERELLTGKLVHVRRETHVIIEDE